VSICLPYPRHASGTKATAEAGHNITDAKFRRRAKVQNKAAGTRAPATLRTREGATVLQERGFAEKKIAPRPSP